jgi:hypothetical protein
MIIVAESLSREMYTVIIGINEEELQMISPQLIADFSQSLYDAESAEDKAAVCAWFFCKVKEALQGEDYIGA